MKAPSSPDADLSLLWLARSLTALAPAIRTLPDAVVLPPDLLPELGQTADVIQRIAACLQSATRGASA
jgi:hypothetical protein